MSLTSASIGQKLEAAGPVAEDLEAVWRALWRQPHVPASTIELCRLLLARRHRARSEILLRNPTAGVPEEKIAALKADRWTSDPVISAAERAALEFTDYFHVDAESIPDEVADAVTAHYGETGLVALIEALCFIDGRIRLALIFSEL